MAFKSSSEEFGEHGRRSISRRLVDVMLVLLIIFIVTAPMLVQGLQVQLPREAASPLAHKGPEPHRPHTHPRPARTDRDQPVHPKLLAARLGPLLPAARAPCTSKATNASPTASSSTSWRR